MCVGATSNACVHGLSFQATYTSVTFPPTSLTPWLKYLCGSVVNALERLTPTGSKHTLELNPGLHTDIGKSAWGLGVGISVVEHW